MDIAVYICGVLFAIASLWLGYLGVSGHLRDQKLLGLWVLYGALIFILTGAFLYFTQKLWNDIGTAFTVIEANALLLSDDAEPGDAVAWYEWNDKIHNGNVSPIQRLSQFRLTNRQQRRSQIETFRFEIQDGNGNWQPIVNMLGYNRNIYFGQINDAKLLNLTSLGEQLLLRFLDFNETAEGWEALEIPAGISANRPLRMYIKDYGGTE